MEVASAGPPRTSKHPAEAGTAGTAGTRSAWHRPAPPSDPPRRRPVRRNTRPPGHGSASVECNVPASSVPSTPRSALDAVDFPKRGAGLVDLVLQEPRLARLDPLAAGGVPVRGGGHRAPGSGFRAPGSGFRAPGSGFRAPGSGFWLRAPGSGLRAPDSVDGYRTRTRERERAWEAEQAGHLQGSRSSPPSLLSSAPPLTFALTCPVPVYGIRSPEAGTRRPEPGARNPEPGARELEPRVRSPGPGSRIAGRPPGAPRSPRHRGYSGAKGSLGDPLAEVEGRRRNGPLGAAILRGDAACARVGVVADSALGHLATPKAVNETARLPLGTTLFDAREVADSIVRDGGGVGARGKVFVADQRASRAGSSAVPRRLSRGAAFSIPALLSRRSSLASGRAPAGSSLGEPSRGPAALDGTRRGVFLTLAMQEQEEGSRRSEEDPGHHHTTSRVFAE